MPSTSGEDTIPTVITGPVHVEMKDREPTEDDWENMRWRSQISHLHFLTHF